MRPPIAAVLTAILTVLSSETFATDNVTLTARDGALSVSGRFLNYDGAFYRIDSIYGVLTVDGAGVSCSGIACPAPGAFVAELMVSGAKAASERLLPPLLEAFATERGYSFVRQTEDASHFLYVLTDPEAGVPVARIRFRATTSDEGMADLIAEQADIALTFREPSAQERDRALEAGLGDLTSPARSQILALDGVVAVVSPDNPMRGIDLNALTRVLSGEITNWSDLGYADAPISLHLPARPPLADRLLPEGAASPEGTRRYLSGPDLASAIGENPYAIGITAFSDVATMQVLDLSGTCSVSVSPRPRSIQTGDYPLVAPHYMFTPGRRSPTILRDFVRFIRSDAAQTMIKEQGFVDQGLALRSLELQGDRLIRAIQSTGRDVNARDLRRMVDALDGAEQVSLTFRFEDGTLDLDARSRANLPLLTAAIRQGDYDNATLLLAGFSDGQGGGAENLDLSRKRATAVRDAILATLPAEQMLDVVVEGFGEALPMACDQDSWGRQANRRVEVWVRQK